MYAPEVSVGFFQNNNEQMTLQYYQSVFVPHTLRLMQTSHSPDYQLPTFTDLESAFETIFEVCLDSTPAYVIQRRKVFDSMVPWEMKRDAQHYAMKFTKEAGQKGAIANKKWGLRKMIQPSVLELPLPSQALSLPQVPASTFLTLHSL
jgi:hypothetical protein